MGGFSVGHRRHSLVQAAPQEPGQEELRAQPSFETSTLQKSLQSFSLFRLLAPFLDMEHLAIDFRVNQHFIAYSFWSQVPYPPVAVEAKDVSLETLERMARILDDRGVGLALVALPTREQVYSGEPYGPGFDIDFPQAYLQLFAREQGIPYLDLLPIFREHVSRTNENIYVKGDTHLNNEGHALAGWHISEWFRCCVMTSCGLFEERAPALSLPGHRRPGQQSHGGYGPFRCQGRYLESRFR